MTLVICSYVSNHAAVPLVAMLIKLMYEAVLMANIPIAFIICNCYDLISWYSLWIRCRCDMNHLLLFVREYFWYGANMTFCHIKRLV